jgi:hypothetical protein
MRTVTALSSRIAQCSNFGCGIEVGFRGWRFFFFLKLGGVGFAVVLFEELLKLGFSEKEGVLLNEFGLLLILDGDLLILVKVSFFHQWDVWRFNVATG